MKSCSRNKKGLCKANVNPQDLACFSPNKATTDGLASWCKSCISAVQREKHYLTARARILLNPDKEKRYKREHYIKNQDRYRTLGKIWVENNREKTRNSVREYESKNPEKKLARSRDYYLKNQEKIKIYRDFWNKQNSALKLYYTRKRQANKLNATPNWLTSEQLKEIERYYEIAKVLSLLMSVSLEVDHIIPLQGKNVRGLHVPWNLQILPASENRKKGNRVPILLSQSY